MASGLLQEGNIPDLLRKLSAKERSGGVTALVAKQPVFDRAGVVWGYELLFRDPLRRPGLAGKSAGAATSTVMIDGFELMRPALRGKQRFLINFSADFLEAELPAVLPPDVCVIEILEDSTPTPGVLQGIANLKKQGYTVALDDYVGQSELAPFLPLVDIVKVDVCGMSRKDIAALSASLAPSCACLLAEKVEDQGTADFCLQQGYSLFQGYYFSKAEVVSGKKLSPSQLTQSRLLTMTIDDSTPLPKLSEIVASDVYLAYRLLKYINSVYFGLPMQVTTVDHAIAMLGTLRIRQWLFVTAMAGMGESAMSQEILYISAFRAKFMELLATMANQGSYKPLASKLFLTGLFSLLESMLHVPLELVFESVYLDPDILKALAGRPGPLTPWFELMLAYEKGDWEQVRTHADVFALSDLELAAAYIEAGSWSTTIFNTSLTS